MSPSTCSTTPSTPACALSAWCRRTEPARRFAHPILMGPVEYLRTQHAELTALRRDLHAHPELGFEEHRTAEVVTGELHRLGLECHSGVGKTGVVAVIPGPRQDSGRAVGLRAATDALPMHEGNGFPPASRVKGRLARFRDN